MSYYLNPFQVAIQGAGFVLNPIAMAVQGFLTEMESRVSGGGGRGGRKLYRDDNLVNKVRDKWELIERQRSRDAEAKRKRELAIKSSPELKPVSQIIEQPEPSLLQTSKPQYLHLPDLIQRMQEKLIAREKRERELARERAQRAEQRRLERERRALEQSNQQALFLLLNAI